MHRTEMRVKSLALFAEHTEDGSLGDGEKIEVWAWEMDRGAFRVALTATIAYVAVPLPRGVSTYVRPPDLWAVRDVEFSRYSNAQRLNEARVFADPDEGRPLCAAWVKWFKHSTSSVRLACSDAKGRDLR